MEKSRTSVIGIRARNIITLLFLSIFTIASAIAQPVWVPTTPSVPSTGPLSISLNYGIDRVGTVYVSVVNYDYSPTPTSAQIKAGALAGPSGGRVATAVLPVTAGNINIVLNYVLDVIDPNKLHSIFIVAEDAGLVLQAAPVKLLATTLLCPAIDILTGFSQFEQCVNLGAEVRFNVVIMDPDPQVNGIIRGTEWTLDWGDGIIDYYTSVADNDLPPLAVRTHTYSSITDCNYVFTNSIDNQCGNTRSVQYVAVVHGRDIPSDGDGLLEIVNDATSSTTVQVCAGTETIITIRDNSTWNCQNPSLPGGLTPVPNSDDRNIEWLYGQDPVGGIFNTITGTVAISALGDAPQAGGRLSPVPNEPNSLSNTITIPSSCVAGEYFRVYMKNWNKCNWADPDYVYTYVNIEVVATPDAPTAPDKTICIGDDRTLSVTSAPVGTITWYSDAGLTTAVGTGITYTPTETAAGTYNYWVTDRETTGLLCQSYPTMLTLLINPKPSTPTLTYPNKNDICYGVEPPESYIITASAAATPPITGYQWFMDGFLLAGRTSDTIIITKPLETGSYTACSVGAAPSYCLSDPSAARYVTVHTLLNVTHPVDQSICEDGTAIFTATTTEDIASWQWENSDDGGVTFSTVGAAAPHDGFNTNTLTITAPGTSYDGYWYRVEMKTPPGQGGCAFKSDAALLTVDGLPSVDAGPDITLCTATPLNPIYMTGAIQGGSASSVIWSGGAGLGTWTQNADASQAYFSPTVSEGSFIAIINITGTAACGAVVVSGTRTVSWSEIPLAEAGADISRCDATPLAAFIMTGATAAGSYSSLNWTGGEALGSWTQNADPALAVFTPSVTSGSFTAILTLTGNGACTGTNPTDTKLITWGETPLVVAGPAIDRCDGTPQAAILMTGASSSGTYTNQTWSGGAGLGTWTQNTDPSLATFTPSVNVGSFTATLSLTGTGACTGSDASDIRTITWSWEATVDAGPDQSICATATAPLAGVIGANATTGTWSGGTGTYNPDNTTPDAIYTPSAAEKTAQTVTLTLTTDDPPGICPVVSDDIIISIGTLPTTATLTSSGDECFGAASSWINSVISGGAPPYIIKYELNGTPEVDITNYYSGNNFDLGILAIGTYTYEITEITDDCGNVLPGAGLPGPVTFDIYENPNANAGSDKFTCGPVFTSITAIPSIGTGTWTKVSGPGTVSFTPDENTADATATVSEYGSYVLRWTEVNGGICSSSSDITADFEKIAAAGIDQDLCDPPSAVLAGNTPAVGTGTWTKVSGPGTVSFSPNANTPDATATVSDYGTYVFKWTIDNGGLCSTNEDVSIVYNPDGQVNQPADQVVCNGNNTADVNFTTTNTIGTTSYAWTNTNSAIGLGASGAGNISSFTAVNATNTPVVAIIEVTATLHNAPVSCPGTPVSFTITVNPTGQVDQPSNLTLCEGSTGATTFSTVNTGGTTSYTWTNSDPAIGLPASGTGDISFTTTNTGTSPVTGTIIVTPIFNNGGADCPGSTKSFTITVNPEGQVDQPADLQACNNSPASVTFTTQNTGGVTTYEWTNNNTNIGLGTDGTGNISFTATNAGTSPISATIVVTPVFNNAALDCSGPSKTFIITVNPTPTLSSTLTPADICSNTVFSYTPTSATAGTTFDWSRADVAGITPPGPSSGTDNPNETLRNLTNIPIGVTYQYTLTANGCSNIQNVIVSIKPEPVVAAGQIADICSGNALNHHIDLVNFINPLDNVTFTWLAPDLNPVDVDFSGGNARSSASMSNISDDFLNTTGSDGTATYTITPYKDGCAGVAEDIIATIRSQPVLNSGLGTTECSNTAIGLVLSEAAGSVAADYYNISQVILDPGLSAVAGNAPIAFPTAPPDYLANDKYLNITGVDKKVTYKVQPIHAPDCFGAIVDVEITIRPQPYIVPAQTKTVCSDVSIGKEILLSPVNIPAATLFNWPAPDMSDFSAQGTPGVNVVADPAGTIHINDLIHNSSGAPITATYYVTPVSTSGCAGTEIPLVITIDPEPLPKAISGRDKVCIGEVNLVYNVASAVGSTFHWTVDPAIGTKTFDFNTNSIIMDAAVAPGSGNITVYETNSYTCDGDLSTLPVQVYDQALPEDISGPADVCANSTQVYSITNRVGSVYSWTIPGGAAIAGDPSAASITIIFGNVGGIITVDETNIAGCVTNHNPFLVTVKPLPTAVISGGGTICEGNSVDLTVNFAGTAPFDFIYALNGVSQAPVNTSDDPYLLNVTQAGTYTIVDVTDATTCTNSGFGSALVTYYPKPTGIISGDATICGGESTLLTMTFTGTAPYTFTYTDGVTPLTVPNYPNSVYTVSVSPAVTSTYILTSLTDGNSCDAALSGSALITVNEPPALTLTGTNLTCNNDNTGAVNLTASGNNPFGFAWTGPGGYTANIEDISGLEAGTYEVTVTDTKGCISIESIALTEPGPLDATLASTDIYCFGSTGSITISAPSGGSGSYEYTINGGTSWFLFGDFSGLNPDTYDVRMRDVLSPVCDKVLDAALEITGPAELDATVTATDVDCYGANNGSIIISWATGGFGTYEYTIDGGATWQGSGNFTNLAPNTYNAQIRDAAYPSCVVVLNNSVIIQEPTELNATVNSTNVSCFGSSDGSIIISAPAGGHGTYEYSINGGGSWQGSGSFSALAPGTYNVQIRDGAFTSCYKILNNLLAITQPAVLQGTLSSTMISCNGADDGIIDITAPSGGSGTYEYTTDGGLSWLPGGLFNGLTPGSYDVRMRDALNTSCELILDNGLDITEPPALSATVTSSDITCFGADDGTITVNNSAGGYGTYEYSIDGGIAWQSSNSFTGLTAASYNVQIRDKARTGCVEIIDPAVVISEPVVLTASVASTNVSCFNANDGTITVSSASGGYGTYEYSINGGASWQGSANFINLGPGSYDVRVRDATSAGCFLILDPNLIISEPSVLSATASSTNVTCNGAGDGIITINGAAGGYGTYEYTVDGGSNWQASNSFTALNSGFYNVRIRDAVNQTCIMTIDGSLNISEPPALNASLAKTNITCNAANDGIITISSPTGGYGTYEFTIDGAASWQSSGSFTNLIQGTYDVRMRDAVQTACEVTLDPAFVITEPAALAGSVTSTNVSCFGANDGTITISGVSGGLGTYEYSINGGATWSGLAGFSNLPPATYDVKLRDAVNNGCILTLDAALVISEPAALNATVNKNDISCFGASDGTISISAASGGYGTYEYTINGGGSWQALGNFTGLGPGNYNVQMRDAVQHTCIEVLDNAMQIIQPAILNAVVTPTNITCNSADDGIINITAPSGGSGTYEYSIDGGTSWQSAGLFNSLAPATYNVQIRDAVSITCVITLNSSLTITEPAVVAANLSSSDISCFGANDGTITVSFASGGYGTYDYSIDGGATWPATGSFTNLLPGFYNVQIRDRAHTSCVTILDPALEITEPAALSSSVTSTDVTCFGAENGTISISAPSGGYGTYQYSVDGGSSWQSSGTYIGLIPGSYNVRMRDAASTSCIITLDPALLITEPAVLSASVNSTNVSCYNANDGIITISAPSGGYGTYEYTIDGGSTWQSSANFTALSPGFYGIQMRDAANTGCVKVLDALLTITEPGALGANVAEDDITCNGANDGKITISLPTGGYGTYEYSIDGASTWQATGTYTILASGTYDVQLRDAVQTGCVEILDPALVIDEPAILNASLTSTDISCNGANDGTISITGATGGYGAYQYTINGGTTWFSSGLFAGLVAGSYDVQMRDAANPVCLIILDPTLIISEPAVLSATVNSTDVSCYGSTDGTITITAPSGGYGTYEYSINGGGSWQSSGSYTSLAPGSYNVRIRDAANTGCYIVLDPALLISQPNVMNAVVTPTNVSCNSADDGIIDITAASGGSGTYGYSIDGGISWQAVGLFSPLSPATYNVQIRDAANISCIIILNSSLTITEPDAVAANLSSTNVTCFSANDGTITISFPTGGYGTYEYSNDGGTTWQATGSFVNLSPAFYNVQIRDKAHTTCVTILDPVLEITEPAILSAIIASSDVTCFGASDGTITISNPLGGYGTYEYSRDGGTTWQGSGNFSGLAPASYNVMIRDAANTSCEITLDPALAISEPAVLSATLASTNISCFAAADGSITISSPLGGYGTYEYTVDGGITWQGSGNFSSLTPGYYNVQIRDAANTACVQILDAALQISQPGALSANVTSTNVNCNGDSDGIITISGAAGGYGSYEYSSDGGTSWQGSGSYTNLAPGTYNIQLRDAANISCVEILDAALIITEPAVLNATVTPIMVSCFGTADGIITISNPSGGSGAYQYSIDAGTAWQGSAIFMNLAPADYDVRIRDASSTACVIVLDPALTITQPAVLSATVNSTDVSCYGSTDGTITITAPSGGYGTYEYSINGGGSWQSSGSFISLGPGSYNVQIRDAANTGCYIVLDPALLISQPNVMNAVVTPANVSCNSADDGIIDITAASGGSGVYGYSTDGGTSWQAAGLFNSLPPASYNVQMRDAANITCSIILNSALTISEPAAITAGLSSTNVTCFNANDGTITISLPTGGYGTYEYSNDGGTTWQATGSFVNLTPAFYNVQIRDKAHTTCVTILDPALEITEPAILSAIIASNDVTCFGANNGSITLTSPAGGYGTYEYSSDGGTSWQASANFTGLAPGTYNVMIRDAANTGCEITLDPALAISEPAVLSATVASTNVTCFGAADGSITITSPLGGYGTYEYTVNGGTSWQVSGDFTALTPGFYNVQIRDAANTACVIIINGSLRITEPAVLAAFVSKTDVTCNGGSDGTITVSSASGGYGTYEYSNDGAVTWQGSANFTNLTPGSYNVQIRDAANTTCIIVLDAALIINEPAVLSAAITTSMVTCFAASDGIITVSSPSGGSGAYQYSVDGGTSWQGSGMFMNLAPANYDVRIRDAINQACIITLDPSVAITEPGALSASITSTNVSCFGGGDGSITISSPLGGYGTYEYSINGGGSWQASANFTSLTPGSYSILIRDAAHITCMVILDNAYIISQPGLLTANVSKTDVTCNGLNDGIITISSPAGGNGTYEYSVDGGTSWQGSGNYTNLPPATYDVRIRDMANPACSVILYPNLMISEPLVFEMTSTGDIILGCYGDTDGMGTFYGSGGTLPFTFTVISNTAAATFDAPGFNSQSFYGAGAGSITVSVTDFSGCVAQGTILITQPLILSPGTIAADQVLCQDGNPALITESVPAAGGPGSYTYQWQYSTSPAGSFINIAGGTSSQYTPPAGAVETLYYRRMLISGMCTPVYSNVIEIMVNPKPVALLSGGATICPAETSVLKADISTGTGPFELDIENHGIVSGYISGANIIVSPAVTTTYKLLSVRDANGCEVLSPSSKLMGSATVIVRDLPAITSSPVNETICEYGMVKFEVSATGSDLTYQWYVDGGSGFNSLTDDGVYVGAATSTLNIFGVTSQMDSNVYHAVVSGCSVSETSSDAMLLVNTNPEILSQPKDITVCMNADAGFRVSASGTGITYQWQVNKGSGFINVVDDANHSGANNDSLEVFNTTPSMNGWIYRAIVIGTCNTDAYSSFAVLNVTPEPVITQQPSDNEICEGLTASFLVNATGPGISYQWQYNDGSGWNDLSDGTIYTGTQSQQLRLDDVPVSASGQIRAAVIAECRTVYSDVVNLTVNANPIVDFSGIDPLFVCGGVDTQLDGNPAGGSGTYTIHSWTGQIGPIDDFEIQDPVFNTRVSGFYNLNYTVTDNKGCMATDKLTVQVEMPVANFNATPNSGCPPLDVSFTDASVNASVYHWNFGDGSAIDNTAGNVTHRYTNTTTSLLYYDVELNIETANGCKDSLTMGVTIYPEASADFELSADTICSGDYLVLSSLPGAAQYYWDYGDGAAEYGTNVINHIFLNSGTSPGIYTIRLTTTSYYSCDDWIEKQIVVYPQPVAGFLDPPDQVYPDATVSFTNTTLTGNWVYEWNFNDGNISTEENPTHTYTAPDDYEVWLKASNSECIDSAYNLVSIIPTPPIPDFDSLAGACEPYTIIMTNNSEFASTYLWEFGDGGISTSFEPRYTYYQSGIFRITLTTTGPGGVRSTSRLIYVYETPMANFEVAPSFVYVNDVAVRCFNLSDNANSFIWEFGDGDTSHIRDPYHKYLTEGIYDITLHAYSDNACYDSYTMTPAVTVEPAGELRFANVFRPNSDGPTGGNVDGLSSDQIDGVFFPPLTKQVDEYKLQIFNRSGVLIFESKDINIGWDGYYKGKRVMQGVYVWYVEGKYSNGKPFMKTGDITLLH